MRLTLVSLPVPALISSLARSPLRTFPDPLCGPEKFICSFWRKIGDTLELAPYDEMLKFDVALFGVPNEENTYSNGIVL